ncbi:MAG: hypothetical protein AAF645_00350 [Myxococcota bacterium]
MRCCALALVASACAADTESPAADSGVVVEPDARAVLPADAGDERGLDDAATGDTSPPSADASAPPPVGRPRPPEGLGFAWVADGTPDPGLPVEGVCGGCSEGALRCLSDVAREECRDDGTGCVRWQPAESCAGADYCQQDGSCGAENPCTRENDVERCDERGSIRSCVRVGEEVLPSEARVCDVEGPPPFCDGRAMLGVISFSQMGVGSCLQVNNRYGTVSDEGELIGVEAYAHCGPCSWFECVLGEDGVARFECRSAYEGEPIDWTAIPREMSPPMAGAYGYTCSALRGKPVQSNSKIKRGGSNPWMVASHYQGAACPVRRDWN